MVLSDLRVKKYFRNDKPRAGREQPIPGEPGTPYSTSLAAIATRQPARIAAVSSR